MRFEVEPEQLRSAAQRVGGVTEAVDRLGVERRLDGVAAAVPGGLLAAAAAEAGLSWRWARSRVLSELTAHVLALRGAADRYRAVDDSAAGGSGRPVR